MIKLQNHPGVIILSRDHKGQQRVLLYQPHRIPEPGIIRQCRNIILRLLMEVPRGSATFPGMGCPTYIGLLILEAGDNCCEDVVSAADVNGDGSGLDEDDSLGPDVGARLEGRALLDLRCGTGEGAWGPILVWYRRNP